MLASNRGTICTPLEMTARDNKQRRVLCADTIWILRIIQAIPSPKAEPFKQWLAKVGSERIDEINNPELAQDRMKQLFEQKGYSKERIDKRLRWIAVRQELTEEREKRWAKEGRDYAVLTNEIMNAAFGMDVQAYKIHKWLKQHNLRDHMNDLELILTMLGEATTTSLHRKRNSKALHKLQQDAQDWGKVAGKTRKDIEKQLWDKVTSQENYLYLTEKRKRLKEGRK